MHKPTKANGGTNVPPDFLKLCDAIVDILANDAFYDKISIKKSMQNAQIITAFCNRLDEIKNVVKSK